MPDSPAISSRMGPASSAVDSGLARADFSATVCVPKGMYLRFGKRLCDLVGSFLGMLFCAPAFALIAFAVKVSSPGPIIFRQARVGKDGKQFMILKFRSMVDGAHQMGRGITPEHDVRVTSVGAFLRRWKLDELPQLWNVFIGQMSLIGPRPELPTYVAAYSELQRTVLRVRPGITDEASIQYRDEGRILEQREDPERYYREHVLPDKLSLNLQYVNNISFSGDTKLLLATVRSVFGIAESIGGPTKN